VGSGNPLGMTGLDMRGQSPVVDSVILTIRMTSVNLQIFEMLYVLPDAKGDARKRKV
jgi:hypothetical protein